MVVAKGKKMVPVGDKKEKEALDSTPIEQNQSLLRQDTLVIMIDGTSWRQI
jgi:hypothetical protein